jgi:hypothetical protein
MRKVIVGIAAVAVVAAVTVGCASAPDTPPARIEEQRFTIIEHKNSTLGGDIPDWTMMDVGRLEEEERFEGKRVYRFERTGRDLDGTKALVDNMDAPSAIAREVSTRVEQVFAGAEVGDDDAVETYFENVVKTIARTEVNGFRKYGDFWVLKQYTNADGSPGQTEYAYYTLYTVDEEIVRELVERAIEDVEADSEEELTARERVRRVLEDEF